MAPVQAYRPVTRGVMIQKRRIDRGVTGGSNAGKMLRRTAWYDIPGLALTESHLLRHVIVDGVEQVIQAVQEASCRADGLEHQDHDAVPAKHSVACDTLLDN